METLLVKAFRDELEKIAMNFGSGLMMSNANVMKNFGSAARKALPNASGSQLRKASRQMASQAAGVKNEAFRNAAPIRQQQVAAAADRAHAQMPKGTNEKHTWGTPGVMPKITAQKAAPVSGEQVHPGMEPTGISNGPKTSIIPGTRTYVQSGGTNTGVMPKMVNRAAGTVPGRPVPKPMMESTNAGIINRHL